MKQITVDIGPDGQIRIEAAGYAPGECLQATKAIEDALGTAGERTRKLPEPTVGTGLQVKTR